MEKKHLIEKREKVSKKGKQSGLPKERKDGKTLDAK
jgi:hypothetical protein